MYAKPSLHVLDLAAAAASCCRVLVDDREVVNTGICPFPTCRIIEPCTLGAGPVTVSGT